MNEFHELEVWINSHIEPPARCEPGAIVTASGLKLSRSDEGDIWLKSTGDGRLISLLEAKVLIVGGIERQNGMYDVASYVVRDAPWLEWYLCHPQTDDGWESLDSDTQARLLRKWEEDQRLVASLDALRSILGTLSYCYRIALALAAREAGQEAPMPHVSELDQFWKYDEVVDE